MEKYSMFIDGNKITIQKADYIEDGIYIEIINSVITLYEIPLFAGAAVSIGTYDTIIEAIEFSKTLT